MHGAVFIRTAFIADDEKCLKKDTKNPQNTIPGFSFTNPLKV
jgi:hypothetical protein